jgi:hypothetical protein
MSTNFFKRKTNNYEQIDDASSNHTNSSTWAKGQSFFRQFIVGSCQAVVGEMVVNSKTLRVLKEGNVPIFGAKYKKGTRMYKNLKESSPLVNAVERALSKDYPQLEITDMEIGGPNLLGSGRRYIKINIGNK